MRELGMQRRPARPQDPHHHAGKDEQRADDLLNRDFTAPGPTAAGSPTSPTSPPGPAIVYVAFVVDIYSRRDRRLVGRDATSGPSWCWTPWTWRCGGGTAPGIPPGRA